MLKGGQKKLDTNKDGEISGDDFKLLRSKKPEMKSKGGSIFSRKNYKQTGKI